MTRPPKKIDAVWSRTERKLLDRLASPYAIQEYLDQLAYSIDSFYRSPRQVMRDRAAHCLDGALFAAAALRRLGHPPLLVDLRANRDDDHLLAIFRRDGLFGAVAKSNFVTLRYREPVYRSLRELVMSYFEGFFNVAGDRSLREYSRPFALDRFDHLNWMTDNACLDAIAVRLDASRHYPVAPPKAIAALHKMDARSYQAAMLGVREEGLYRP